MNDKELADRVSIILGAKHCDGPFPDNWYFPDQEIEKYLGFNDAALVRDWRVAGAMMEKVCEDGETAWIDLVENRLNPWQESLPRAINEACVEALEG